MPILLFLTVVLWLARRTDQMIRERVMGVKKNTILKVEFPESSAKKKKSDKQLMTDWSSQKEKHIDLSKVKGFLKMEIRALWNNFVVTKIS